MCLAQVPLGIRLVPGVCMRALGDYSPGMHYARGSQTGLLKQSGKGTPSPCWHLMGGQLGLSCLATHLL